MVSKNKLRAVFAAALTVLMGSALATPALGAGEGGTDGPGAPGGSSVQSSTAVPPASGDLVIHKFIGAPVGATDRNGTKLDTSGWTSATPANGVVFDLYQVGPPAAVTPPADPWPDVPPLGTYVKNASTLEVYSGTTLIGEYGLTAASTASVMTATDGTGTASGLPQGLYLVIENAAASTKITNANTGATMHISQTAAPFVVPVPMTNPTGDGWLDVVHVYPKNEALTVEKVVDQAGAVAVGDTVHYTITTSVPSDIAGSKKFEVFDKLDAALDLVQSSVTVATVPALTGSDALVSGTDYTISWDDPTRKMLVSFNASGLTKLAKATSVVVELDSKINAKILDSADLSVPNVANVEFTNGDGTDFASESEPPSGETSDIHTAAIKITKVDQAGQPLNGAKFKLASSEANAKAGQFLRIDPATKAIADYDASPTSAWTTLGAANDYEISPANSASFVGLRDFVEAGGVKTWQTYWVVETAAPATFNMLSQPVKADFEDAFNQSADPGKFDHVYSATVKNSQGFMLPETGGAGTIAWTVAGVVLVGVAALLVATRRKKDATEYKDAAE